MKEQRLRAIIEGFHYGMDGGLPVDCCGVAKIESAFDAWAKKEYPDVYDNAGDLEAYMIDEEEIGPIADFFTTVSKSDLPEAMKGLRDSIKGFYSEGPDAGSDDDQERTAAETLADIEAYLEEV